MKKNILMALGLVAMMWTAACHKVAPVAAKAPPPTPVASTPRDVPAPVRNPAPVTASNTPRSANRTPASDGRLPPDVRATLNERLAHLEDALFDFDRYTIRQDATTALRDDVNVIRGILASYPQQKLVIEGNADERGSDEYNLALGDKRARAAEEFLSNMGIPVAQLTLISYGKDRPVCTDETESCWQKNRRAHITAAP